MKPSQFTPSVFLMVGLAFAGEAAATTTTATAWASALSLTVSQTDTGDATGAQASASQTIPSAAGDVFVSGEATSVAGALGAAGVASTEVPTDVQAVGFAGWADGFVITAPGYDSAMTGTFSGSALVSGDLSVEFIGRAYADAQVFGHIVIHPNTGYNGGVVVVDGSARHTIGYDIGERQSGSEDFTLSFVDVPFTFGRDIDLYMSLSAWAWVRAIDPGAGGQAETQYGHTMTWGGLSEVRDSTGQLLTDYSAVSAGSGFNFASPTPGTGPGTSVPEPSSSLLVLAGLFSVAWRSLKTMCRECGPGSGKLAAL
jgi:hypothetical protein